MPCLFLKEERTFTSLCAEGRLREMDSSVLPRGQESVRLCLLVTTPVLCPSSPETLPVPSSGFLQPPSHVLLEVKPVSSRLWLWLSVPYSWVHRERCWQFIHVLHENYTHNHSCPTASWHNLVSAYMEVSVA